MIFEAAIGVARETPVSGSAASGPGYCRCRYAQSVVDGCGRGPRVVRGGHVTSSGQPRCFRRLRRLAAAWPQATWTIEDAGGLGAPPTERLRRHRLRTITRDSVSSLPAAT